MGCVPYFLNIFRESFLPSHTITTTSACGLKPTQPFKTLRNLDLLTCPASLLPVLYAPAPSYPGLPPMWLLSPLRPLLPQSLQPGKFIPCHFPGNFVPSCWAISHVPFWPFNQNGTPEQPACPSSLLLSYPPAYLLASLPPHRNVLRTGSRLPIPATAADATSFVLSKYSIELY